MNTAVYTYIAKGYEAYTVKRTRDDGTLTGFNPFDGYEKLFIPLHLSATHWGLVVILMMQRKIIYYDSISGYAEVDLQIFKRWLNECAGALNVPDFSADDWIVEDMKDRVPQQTNCLDCGVYAMMFADFLSDDLELSFNDDAIDFFRIKIAADIMRGQLSYPIS